MAYLIIFLMFIAFCGFWMMLNMPPQKIASLLVHTGPIVIIGLGVVLTFFRRGVIGLPLIFLGLSLWRRSRSMRPPTYSDGHTSKVRSVYLEMELDHDTGEMDGRVLRGRLEGVKLSSLDKTEILSLYHDISDDADSVALLESFLDRYYSDWRENYEHGSSTGTGGASGFESMSRDEAYQILGLEPGASQEEIHQAWRRLVKAVHPDSGGSAFLTAKINAARDLLLS